MLLPSEESDFNITEEGIAVFYPQFGVAGAVHRQPDPCRDVHLHSDVKETEETAQGARGNVRIHDVLLCLLTVMQAVTPLPPHFNYGRRPPKLAPHCQRRLETAPIRQPSWGPAPSRALSKGRSAHLFPLRATLVYKFRWTPIPGSSLRDTLGRVSSTIRNLRDTNICREGMKARELKSRHGDPGTEVPRVQDGQKTPGKRGARDASGLNHARAKAADPAMRNAPLWAAAGRPPPTRDRTRARSSAQRLNSVPKHSHERDARPCRQHWEQPDSPHWFPVSCANKGPFSPAMTIADGFLMGLFSNCNNTSASIRVVLLLAPAYFWPVIQLARRKPRTGTSHGGGGFNRNIHFCLLPPVEPTQCSEAALFALIYAGQDR